MRGGAVRRKVLAATAALSILLTTLWAAPLLARGAAHTSFLGALSALKRLGQGREAGRRGGAALPSPARFRESESRGLLVKTWVNGVGPFEFAVDTGAGANIISGRVAAEARVEVETGGGAIRLGGLSGRSVGGARRAFVRDFAVGARGNTLPSKGLSIVAEGLPEDVDGVLDPTEAFSPLGYVIDLPRETISAFDPRATPLRESDAPAEGTVARWLTEPGSRRPYVMLAQGRRALIDTGSGFGLAVTGASARALGVDTVGGRPWEGTHDLAGGSIPARRVRPASVSVGTLLLRNVPTDFLPEAESGAPVLLGRDALRPFRISFDPVNRLIRIEPS